MKKSLRAIGSCLFIFSLCTTEGIISEEKGLTESAPQNMDLETRLEYARVLSYLKKYDESIEEYKKILAENPGLLNVNIEMGKVYYFKGDHPQALSLLKQVPDDKMTVELQTLLGDIYTSNKEYDKAEEKYRKVLAAESDNDAVKFKLADMLSWQKKYDESLLLYKELVNKHPDDIQLRRKYAMVLNWSGNQAEAAEELKKTLE